MMDESHIARLDMSDADIDKYLEMSRNAAMASLALTNKVREQDQQISKITGDIDDLAKRIDQHEQSEVISSKQRGAIRRELAKRVYSLIGVRRRRGKIVGESKRISNVYAPLFFTTAHHDLRKRFDVAEYSDIRAVDIDDAIAFLRNWEPEEGIDELKAEAEGNWEDNHPEMTVREYLGE